ncbi:MAG: 4-(cytidine 5'-diphospho)-2-C-methyl-D-erythritol kinase [Rhodospirillales bacterium]|nr:4-(cytidine 5'-diphospho)-2-C-methyl-D-erythritol kinase [Rhodospirillales bacterium]
MPPTQTTTQTATQTQVALAKINLYLHVTARRANGYHELDSLVVFADVGDRVTATRANDLSLSVSGPYGSAIDGGADDNLVIKAARTLAKHAGVPARARLHLEKNLPVASGIGGGSADAAATLRALVKLWGLELPDEHIHHAAHQIADQKDTARALEILLKLWRDDLGADLLLTVALELGADVPVCLEGHAAYMGGIGEKLDLAPRLPSAWFVLVNPGQAVSTPTVFQARVGEFSRPARFYQSPHDAAHLAHLLSERRNDLTQAALSLAPVIGEVLAALEAQDGALLARMSGSGATCFALFANPDTARVAAERVRAMHPAWWVAAAKMIDSPLAL